MKEAAKNAPCVIYLMQSRCVRGPGKQVTIALDWDCTQMEKGLNLFLHHCWCNVFHFPLQTMKTILKWINLHIMHSCWMEGFLSIPEMSVKRKKNQIILPSWPCVWPCVCYVWHTYFTSMPHGKIISSSECEYVIFLRGYHCSDFCSNYILAEGDEFNPFGHIYIYVRPWLCALLPVRWEGFWITSAVISGVCTAVWGALKSHCTCQSSVLTDRVRTDVKQNRVTDMKGIPESVTGQKIELCLTSDSFENLFDDDTETWFAEKVKYKFWDLLID